MNGYNNLGLKKHIKEIIPFDNPTLVQEKIIPLAKTGKNIVFTAKTGSGKTLAYTIAFLENINPKLGTQLLIIVPTRELCHQVAKEISQLVKPLDLRVAFFYGGKDMKLDNQSLRLRNHIVVATPGRLKVYVNEKQIKIGDVKLLVFDESDEMFDKGFYGDCAYIKSRVSSDAQIILSSATITKEIKEFMEEIIGEFTFLEIGDLIPQQLIQEQIKVEIPQKNDFLLNYLKKKKYDRVLVFCNRIKRTTSITKFLNDNSVPADQLSSALEQKEREKILNKFKQKKINVVIATDVASRGLHIPNVDCVINYDIPSKPQQYIHRVGRTARNNKEGYAISFVCPEDEERMKNIETTFDLIIPVAKSWKLIS